MYIFRISTLIDRLKQTIIANIVCGDKKVKLKFQKKKTEQNKKYPSKYKWKIQIELESNWKLANLTVTALIMSTNQLVFLLFLEFVR